MSASFEAQVDDWVRETEARMTAVFRQSVQEVIEAANLPVKQGGRMRVDTGFLRSSGRASKSDMPSILPGANPPPGSPKNSFDFNGGEISLVIAGADLGETIYYGYTAAYAAAREYGARGQSPDMFVRGAAQRWPQIVAKVTQEAKARAGR